MNGFIIEYTNQCWHVAGNSSGSFFYIVGYEDRKRLPPHVFADENSAQAVLLDMKRWHGERAAKLKVTEVNTPVTPAQ